MGSSSLEKNADLLTTDNEIIQLYFNPITLVPLNAISTRHYNSTEAIEQDKLCSQFGGFDTRMSYGGPPNRIKDQFKLSKHGVVFS